MSETLKTVGLVILQVRIAETAQRVTDPKYGAGETAFSDGFPVLVSSTASIRQISRKVAWCVFSPIHSHMAVQLQTRPFLACLSLLVLPISLLMSSTKLNTVL